MRTGSFKIVTYEIFACKSYIYIYIYRERERETGIGIGKPSWFDMP